MNAGHPYQQGPGYQQGGGFANQGYGPGPGMMPPPPMRLEANTVSPYAASDNRRGDAEAPFAASGFTDKKIRLRFIRKVYLILTTQLLFTAAIVAFFVLHKPTKEWVQKHSWIYYIAYGVFLVTYITLVCCKGVRRKTPGNYICLIIFTLAFTYMAALISSFYDIQAVLIALGVTCLVCVGVTIFSIQTKWDFTKCGGLLFCLLLVLILFGISIMFVFIFADVDQRTGYILQCVYGCLGALVFSLFLAYDTQLVMGGKKYEYSEEDYISAALQLYLDVVYIFIYMLMAIGGGSGAANS